MQNSKSWRRSQWLLPFILVLVSSLLLSCSPPSSGSFSSRNVAVVPRQEQESLDGPDVWFHEYSTRTVELQVYDWRWFKAQGIVESNLTEDAVSPAGAQGIMQIMPGTWLDLEEEFGIIASPFNAQVNIMFGIRYMHKMVKFWKAPRTEQERLELAQASYNAGAGNILKAQVLCHGKSAWNEIAECLPQVTGRHYFETLNYVKRIAREFHGLTGTFR